MASPTSESAENAVATVVDFASIMVAYNLGVYQLGLFFGFAYAAFDAYIVIWQRKRFANWVRKLRSWFIRNNPARWDSLVGPIIHEFPVFSRLVRYKPAKIRACNEASVLTSIDRSK